MPCSIRDKVSCTLAATAEVVSVYVNTPPRLSVSCMVVAIDNHL